MRTERPLAAYPPEAGRCQVCGWPLADTLENGCVPGNCSMRPKPSLTPVDELQGATRKPYEMVIGERDAARAEVKRLRDILIAMYQGGEALPSSVFHEVAGWVEG